MYHISERIASESDIALINWYFHFVSAFYYNHPIYEKLYPHSENVQMQVME